MPYRHAGKSRFLWQTPASLMEELWDDSDDSRIDPAIFAFDIGYLACLFGRRSATGDGRANADGKHEGIHTDQSGLQGIHRSMLGLHPQRRKSRMLNAENRLRQAGISMHGSSQKIAKTGKPSI
jgi:hypothetical protein